MPRQETPQWDWVLEAQAAPDGRLDRDLKAPSMLPTMIAFGGPGLGTMFVTPSRRYLDAEARSRKPLAGGVFRCDIGARGVAEPRYRG